MITCYGHNDRDHVQILQESLYRRNMMPGAQHDDRLSTRKLGRNWGGFIYESSSKKLLVLIDTDDGSGGTPADCKISWSTFNDILRSHRPDDYIVLKSQVNVDPEYNQFYPFKNDVHSIGIFSNDPERVFSVKRSLPSVSKDIDVFFSGGRKFDHLNPYAWPKNRDPKKWWPGASVRGYKKLQEIKDRHPSINIQIFDGTLEASRFYELINRSKICIDLPGIGLSSRKFYEYMVLGKCVISLQQQHTPWECVPNVHYASLGYDLDFSHLEEKIVELHNNKQVVAEIESSVDKISSQLTLGSMIVRIENIINEKIESMKSQSLFLNM